MKINKKTLGLIIDRSGSVENERLPIEQSLNLLVESFNRKYNNDLVLNIFVVIIGENDLDFNKIEKQVYIQHIEDEEITDILKGIEVLKKAFKNQVKKEIIIFFDGYFIDENWRNNFNNLDIKDLNISVVGIGDGYNGEVLKKFSSNKEIFNYQDIYDLI